MCRIVHFRLRALSPSRTTRRCKVSDFCEIAQEEGDDGVTSGCAPLLDVTWEINGARCTTRRFSFLLLLARGKLRLRALNVKDISRKKGERERDVGKTLNI